MGEFRPQCLALLIAGVSFLGVYACSPKNSQGPSSQGPATGTDRGPGAHDLNLVVGGDTREYRLYLPEGIKAAAKVPLVIVLHGGGASGPQAERLSQMDIVADANGFVVAYPNGTRGPLGGYTWNGGDCCGAAMLKSARDVAFISGLIEALVAEKNVDPTRVYATGISNGAIMVYRLACELSDKVAAIAPVAGTLMVDHCKPTRPVSAIIFHGTADPAVRIDGGWNPRSGARRPFPPLDDVLRTWLELDGCSSKQTPIYMKGTVTCSSYKLCVNSSEVELCLIEGGGHTWPGGATILPRSLVGPTTTDISASEAMWKFFESHPMPPP
jgi:polyhydroxybutyrate depolymerase